MNISVKIKPIDMNNNNNKINKLDRNDNIFSLLLKKPLIFEKVTEFNKVSIVNLSSEPILRQLMCIYHENGTCNIIFKIRKYMLKHSEIMSYKCYEIE